MLTAVVSAGVMALAAVIGYFWEAMSGGSVQFLLVAIAGIACIVYAIDKNGRSR